MKDTSTFLEHIQKGYQFKGDSIFLGTAMQNGEVVKDAQVYAPLATLNRHGLVCGATGTGKTKTLQVLAESLSEKGVSVLLLDIKGDLSGLAQPGVSNAKIEERALQLQFPFKAKAAPVELLSLSNEPGVRLRATVSEFGPVLLSKILGLNDTQGGIMAMLFKYCDDQAMPLVDLEDLQKMLQWAGNEGKSELSEAFGGISVSSVGTIMRKIVELQQQGADLFFGEPSFDTDDLMRLSTEGEGVVSILRVTDLQDRPKLFSTFMLQLLSELYATLPEVGDQEQPNLIMVIDEAHLVFSDASEALLQQLETVVKLIRSKGVGIFFCTQNPMDIPESILGQLGLKVQHALRAFTAKDRKNIKQTAQNYPLTDFYNTEQLITEMGIGEAFVTLLNEKGIPSPLAHVKLRAPQSRMDVLSESEISVLVNNSALVKKYQQPVDRESASEILKKKLETAQNAAPEINQKPQAKEENFWENMAENPVVRSMLRTAGNTIVRSLLGSMGISGSTRRKSTKSWF